MQVDKSCMPTGKIGDWSGAQRSEFGLQSLAVPSLETLDLWIAFPSKDPGPHLFAAGTFSPQVVEEAASGTGLVPSHWLAQLSEKLKSLGSIFSRS